MPFPRLPAPPPSLRTLRFRALAARPDPVRVAALPPADLDLLACWAAFTRGEPVLAARVARAHGIAPAATVPAPLAAPALNKDNSAEPPPAPTADEPPRRCPASSPPSQTAIDRSPARPDPDTRIWNALGKLCATDPEACARHYGNEIVALVSEAWLGPAYTVTSQVNVVRPGGEAQTPHRDYHLGFQAADAVARYPAHVHAMSPMLTLQGAVAHCDMPLESGPTLYMPFTQNDGAGYLAAQDGAVREWFERERVQLPLRKGDAVFFNPALLHAAGTNVSADIRRVANLLQNSSAFGRPMEALDHAAMITTVYPVLRRALADNTLSRPDAARAVAAIADGYSFPTNLDRDPPIGGLAPQSQQALAAEALDADWNPTRFADAVTAQATRRRA